MGVNIRVEVFWVVMPHTVGSSKTLVSYCNIAQHHNPEDVDINFY